MPSSRNESTTCSTSGNRTCTNDFRGYSRLERGKNDESTTRLALVVTHTVGTFERLLRNYLDVRYALEGTGQQLPDTYVVREKRDTSERERPFGHGGQPWPFMEPRHAR